MGMASIMQDMLCGTPFGPPTPLRSYPSSTSPVSREIRKLEEPPSATVKNPPRFARSPSSSLMYQSEERALLQLAPLSERLEADRDRRRSVSLDDQPQGPGARLCDASIGAAAAGAATHTQK
eukprot:scaffold220784_cov32-Tisochrysis_lutea.AAC.8